MVAAYEYGSCHNRLKESPNFHETFYNLSESGEFEYNWTYTNQALEQISIALTSQPDFMDFKNEWENAKAVNQVQLAKEQQ